MRDLTERITVDRVIVRAEANVPTDYLPWATAFVKIKIDWAGKDGLDRLAHRNWRQLELIKSVHTSDLGEYTLYAGKIDQGWILQLDHGRDAYILSHFLGELPILCPTLRVATNLAEASCPVPKSLLYWRPYW
jgi:hypothetical protein